MAGGDTASALAAGSPVVVKAHGAHPSTCEVGKAVQAAVASSGLPEGVFSMLHGDERTTNPGLVIALEGDALNTFRDAAATALQRQTGTTTLTPGIHSAFNDGVEQLGKAAGVTLAARGQNGATACAGQAALFETSAANFLANPALEDEIFGAASLIVSCSDIAQFDQIAEHLDGQLNATMFLTESDRDVALALLPALERKAGRVLINGYPTDVEVSHAMVPDGPLPDTSDSRITSVGAGAIDRFLRPVSYQDLPAFLLPSALQDDNNAKACGHEIASSTQSPLPRQVHPRHPTDSPIAWRLIVYAQHHPDS